MGEIHHHLRTVAADGRLQIGLDRDAGSTQPQDLAYVFLRGFEIDGRHDFTTGILGQRPQHFPPHAPIRPRDHDPDHMQHLLIIYKTADERNISPAAKKQAWAKADNTTLPSCSTLLMR
jgi:hypothetical protein